MPTWKETLPTGPATRGYKLRRTPADAALRAIITSDRFLICDTHFWHGRTLPCERHQSPEGKTLDDSNCAPCLAKQSWRTHCYVAAYDPKHCEQFLFECTDCAALPLEEYFKANGTLRGCLINCFRDKQSKNGKVTILTSAANLQQFPIPKPPDVIAALCVIWRIPRVGVNRQLTGPAGEQPILNQDALRDMHKQPDNAEDPALFEARRSAVIDELRTAAGGNGKTKKQRVPA
jgi:hypothetical protein